jgi:hypothetical protein
MSLGSATKLTHLVRELERFEQAAAVGAVWAVAIAHRAVFVELVLV